MKLRIVSYTSNDFEFLDSLKRQELESMERKISREPR